MATILVGSKYPQNLELNTTINGEIKKVVLNGAKSDLPMGVLGSSNNSLYGATTFTRVDEDFYNEWLKGNGDSALVKNGIIFTAKDEKSSKSVKKERAEEKTGLEGLKVDTEKAVVTDPRAKRA